MRTSESSFRYGLLEEPPGYRLLRAPGTFEELSARARAALTTEGFLLLHTIETSTVMARGGHPIAPLRQLLFFHPDAMRHLLQLDPASVVAAPLKLVLLEEPEGQLYLLLPRAESLFEGHPRLAPLAEELRPRIERLTRTIVG